MAMLGGVFLDVVYNEKPERSVRTTDHPVESGEPVADHVQQQPYVLNITGVISGSDAAARLRKLANMQESGELVKYSHRNAVDNVIIEMFNSTHDGTVANGFIFIMRLKRIRVAKATPVSIMKVSVKTQAASVGNKGLQQKMTPAQMAEANNNKVKGTETTVAKPIVRPPGRGNLEF